MVNKAHDDGTKIQALTLLSVGFKQTQVVEITGISQSQISRLHSKAISRGWNGASNTQLRLQHVVDKPGGGRPTKHTPETDKQLEKFVEKDHESRAMTLEELGEELGISARLVSRRLRLMGFAQVKPSWKPGLTEKMREIRLEWAKTYKNWTIEDWKNVIWTDETSVILGHRRGAMRVWRRPYERFDKTVVRPRWKGASELMFWGSFTYDQKGPCHCFLPEIVKEKQAAERHLKALNKAVEPELRANWELETAMNRLGLRNRPGRKPKWKFTKKNGFLVREGKGGIDWYRYREKILLPLLFPFARRCMEQRPQTVVMEDGAPAHRHAAQDALYHLHEISRLLWMGNSPDLNMIEPAWAYLKRQTTSRGAPKSRADAIIRWEAEWRALPQEIIQRWIERIPKHIEKIIELEGDNNYREGRDHVQSKDEQNLGRRQRRQYYRERRKAKAAGIFDQFEADEARRWREKRGYNVSS